MNNLDVQEFLEGSNELQYVVGIEMSYNTNTASVIINDPEKGKYIEKIEYKPFIYVKDLKKLEIQLTYTKQQHKDAIWRNGIKFRKLRTSSIEGEEHNRLVDGYSYLFESTKSYNALLNYFKDGGLNVYENRDLFYTLKMEEQFLVQSGIRFYKGMEFYNDIHKLYFDIETTGLDPEKCRIFFIGLKDNRDFEKVLKVNKINDDAQEAKMIKNFFGYLDRLQPDIIAGYNSEAFDFNFILKRAEILGIDLNEIKTTLHDTIGLRRKPSTIKLGGETENYDQTIAWGYTVIDIAHSVRKTKAINTDIKEWNLKYITKYQDLNKPNRMYIKNGFDIFNIWQKNEWYVINITNNDYFKIFDELQEALDNFENLNKEGYYYDIPSENSVEELNQFFNKYDENTRLIRGGDIVYQYLLDDLWETWKVDEVFNQDTFLVTKLLPLTFTRKSTMGNSAMWNLLMTAYSYLSDLAIPHKPIKEEFVGGLSKLTMLGYAERIQKFDFASLYPSIKLTYNAFPTCDVDGIMRLLLSHFVKTRSEFKFLASEDSPLPVKDRKLYKIKQLPLKIFNNSEFGATGSEYFNWGEVDPAEFTTSAGRQYLRKAINFFTSYDCKMLICDTDGINVSLPINIDFDIDKKPLKEPIPFSELTYIDRDNKEHKGVKALLKKFNTELLFGEYMKVDDDGRWLSNINLARKNYINLDSDNKVKTTGNTLKSSNLEAYIVDFIGQTMKPLLTNNGKEFVKIYNEYAYKIFYEQIPLLKIASKARIKKSLLEYLTRKVDKTGKVSSQQAFMELILEKNLSIEDLKELRDRFKENYSLKVSEIDSFKKMVKRVAKIDFKASLGEDEFQSDYDVFIDNLFLDIDNNTIEGIVEYVHINDYYKKLVDKASKEIKGFYRNLFTKIKNKYVENVKEFYPLKEEKHKEYKSYVRGILVKYNITIQLGENIYYVNNGTTKSHGDTKLDADGRLLATLIMPKEFERNPDLTGKYNVLRYLDKFNKFVKNLIIVFKPEVQKTIILEPYKVGKGKTAKLEFPIPQEYTDEQLEFVTYDRQGLVELKEYLGDENLDPNIKIDSIPEIMTMQKSEIEFWNRVKLNPYTIYKDFTLPEGEELWISQYYEDIKVINKYFKDNDSEIIVESVYETYPVKEEEINDKYVLLIKDDAYYINKKVDGQQIFNKKININKIKNI